MPTPGAPGLGLGFAGVLVAHGVPTLLAKERAIGQRRQATFPAERATEMRLVGEAGRRRDLCRWRRGLAQKFSGPTQAFAANKSGDIATQAATKQPREINRVRADLLGDLLYLERAVAVRADILAGVF